MTSDPNANWWNFSIDNDKRSEKILEESDYVEVNPPLEGGRLGLTYHNYLGLDRLLQCQIPSSKTPDERIFIITHQLFELAFKELLFDLAVLGKTFHALLENQDEQSFLKKAIGDDRDFWTPALTASARIKFTAKEMMPMIIRYLLNKGEEETFSGVEFYKFREYLSPASGFQAAQYRLIQRAFGKTNMLNVRLFPSQTFEDTYGQPRDGEELTTVVDELIVQEDLDVATPPEKSSLGDIAQFDDLVHKILSRIPKLGESAPRPPSIPKLHSDMIERVIENFETILIHQRDGVEATAERLEREKQSIEAFGSDLKASAERENERRSKLEAAREGAFYLHNVVPESPLTKIMNRLASADKALHGSHDDGFLAAHLRVARENLREVQEHAKERGDPDPPIGTGGGGIPYLGFVIQNLLPMFPAFIAYRELEDSPVLSWIE